MEQYDYKEAVLEDVKNYIINEIDLNEWKGKRDELEEKLNDWLFMEDSVTGNASGSYFCNTWEAEEAIAHNWDLLVDVCNEFGDDMSNLIEGGAESADVSIRCLLLRDAISEALDELEEELEEEDEEEE